MKKLLLIALSSNIFFVDAALSINLKNTVKKLDARAAGLYPVAVLPLGVGLFLLSEAPAYEGLLLSGGSTLAAVGIVGADLLLGHTLGAGDEDSKRTLHNEIKREYNDIQRAARVVKKTEQPSSDVTYNKLSAVIEFKSARSDVEQQLLLAKLLNQLEHLAKQIITKKQNNQSTSNEEILNHIQVLLGDDSTETNVKVALGILNAAIISLENKN